MSGKIFRLTQALEQKFSSFLVARLILATGVPVRRYTAESADEPEVLRKLELVLSSLLSPVQLSALSAFLEDPTAPVQEEIKQQPTFIKPGKNRIFKITQFLSQHRSSFLVGRLILRSGVNVREFTEDAPGDPIALQKVESALQELLTPAEWESLTQSI
jgi:hypothetical protein